MGAWAIAGRQVTFWQTRKMPDSCCAFGCSNWRKPGGNLSFYHIPFGNNEEMTFLFVLSGKINSVHITTQNHTKSNWYRGVWLPLQEMAEISQENVHSSSTFWNKETRTDDKNFDITQNRNQADARQYLLRDRWQTDFFFAHWDLADIVNILVI